MPSRRAWSWIYFDFLEWISNVSPRSLPLRRAHPHEEADLLERLPGLGVPVLSIDLSVLALEATDWFASLYF